MGNGNVKKEHHGRNECRAHARENDMPESCRSASPDQGKRGQPQAHAPRRGDQ